jgi:ADP-ribose pyrophosphatase YjhB (NUDIX family)
VFFAHVAPAPFAIINLMKPLITDEYTGAAGVKYIFEYFECDSFDHLPQDEITQCYAVAFHEDKIVIVHNEKKDTWGLVGGSVEKGEALEETLKREVQEESNMKVLSFRPIGYQTVTDTRGIQKTFHQLRYFATVEPCGPFESDPDHSIDKIAVIDPAEYKKYFDWGQIGNAIMSRALEFKSNSS